MSNLIASKILISQFRTDFISTPISAVRGYLLLAGSNFRDLKNSLAFHSLDRLAFIHIIFVIKFLAFTPQRGRVFIRASALASINALDFKIA